MMEEVAMDTFFPQSFFCFPLVIIIPPLFHTHPSPLPELCDSPDHAGQYHIFGFQVGDFISLLALGWLLRKLFF
jgi:hypothetical protein